MRILAVDDEPIALEGLMSAISEVVPNAEVNGFGNISDALLYAYVNHPQVAFLDVNFRAESGLDLAKRLKEMNPKINIRAPLKIHCCSKVRIFYSRFMSKRRSHTDV